MFKWVRQNRKHQLLHGIGSLMKELTTEVVRSSWISCANCYRSKLLSQKSAQDDTEGKGTAHRELLPSAVV